MRSGAGRGASSSCTPALWNYLRSIITVYTSKAKLKNHAVFSGHRVGVRVCEDIMGMYKYTVCCFSLFFYCYAITLHMLYVCMSHFLNPLMSNNYIYHGKEKPHRFLSVRGGAVETVETCGYKLKFLILTPCSF